MLQVLTVVKLSRKLGATSRLAAFLHGAHWRLDIANFADIALLIERVHANPEAYGLFTHFSFESVPVSPLHDLIPSRDSQNLKIAHALRSGPLHFLYPLRLLVLPDLLLLLLAPTAIRWFDFGRFSLRICL